LNDFAGLVFDPEHFMIVNKSDHRLLFIHAFAHLRWKNYLCYTGKPWPEATKTRHYASLNAIQTAVEKFTKIYDKFKESERQ